MQVTGRNAPGGRRPGKWRRDRDVLGGESDDRDARDKLAGSRRLNRDARPLDGGDRLSAQRSDSTGEQEHEEETSAIVAGHLSPEELRKKARQAATLV